MAGPLLLFKTTAHVVTPGYQVLEQLRVLTEVYGGKIGQYNVQVSPLRQTIGAGCFHQAIDHSTDLGSFYRVAEQSVLASHSKGTDGVLGKVIGNLTPGVKQVVLHVGLLFAGVLYSLFSDFRPEAAVPALPAGTKLSMGFSTARRYCCLSSSGRLSFIFCCHL